MTRQTPLHEIHVELGARMIDFAGWEMPVWYDSAVDEHLRVRSAAGLFDLSHMAELVVSGPDAAAALDRALLVHASAMDPGRARYTMIVDERGGIVDDLIVYRLSDHSFMVVANASNGEAVRGQLTARIETYDAALADETDDWALLAVQGPNSQPIVEAVLTGTDLGALKYYRILEHTFAGAQVLVARTGYTGEDGFELFVAASSAGELWAALSAAGSHHGLAPIGLAARDTLRLEAGMPLYGNELTVDTTPFDVGSGRLVDAERDGYVGAEALAAARDAPARSLRGLVIDGRRPARGGYRVLVEGLPIGTVTSGAPSPTLDANIAIASIDPGIDLAPGEVVEVEIRSSVGSARVVELPFYSRPR